MYDSCYRVLPHVFAMTRAQVSLESCAFLLGEFLKCELNPSLVVITTVCEQTIPGLNFPSFGRKMTLAREGPIQTDRVEDTASNWLGSGHYFPGVFLFSRSLPPCSSHKLRSALDPTSCYAPDYYFIT